MIGRLHGILAEKQAPYLLLDVHDIGYELQAPMTTFYRLPDVGEQVLLYTHFSVSENAQQLFGFHGQRERALFRLLIKISGVGPKMAIAIMSMEVDDFVRCVTDDNIGALVKVPGVGKKTAERLIIEMRDKLKSWSYGAISSVTSTPVGSAVEDKRDFISEAESALISLGYKPAEASKAVSAAMHEDIQRSEDLIRLALRGMLPV